MADFPYLPLWTDAYLADTKHLTTAEHGAYLLLLMTAWRTPGCSLPDDDAFLGRVSGDPRNWPRYKAAVMAFWRKRADGRWEQKRLLGEYESASARRAQASSAGRASALKRQQTNSTDVAHPLVLESNHTKAITKEVKKELNSYMLGGGEAVKKNGAHRVDFSRPENRDAFANGKVAAQIGGAEGWLVVGAARDPSSPEHERARKQCLAIARKVGVRWDAT